MAISAPTFVTSPSDLTNGKVTITATFDTTATDVTNCWSYTKETVTNPEDITNWTVYTDPVEVDANGTVFFMTRKNDLSEIVTAECVIDFIDTEKPTIEATADQTAFTKDAVTVTAAFSDNSGEFTSKEYKKDDGEWTAYTDAGVTFTDNGIVQFRATDKAGNDVAKIVEFTVDNIDKEAPTIAIEASPAALTNLDVTVSATFADNSNEFTSKQYKKDDGEWTAYTEGVKFTENGTVQFKAVDAAGNEATNSFTVDYIDKKAPEAPKATASETEPTNQDVTVSATFADEEGLTNQYRIGTTGDWLPYTGGVAMDKNGTVQFKSTDKAGNESTASYEVTNIDKVLPVVATAADIETPTNQTVTVTATFTDEGGSEVKDKLFSTDGGTTWNKYTAGVEFAANGSVQFKATDNAGNVSEIKTYTVTNIDKVAPVVTPSADVTAITNGDVIVSASATDADSEVASIQYSLDKGTTWLAYDAKTGVKFEENGSVLFKATDTAGNTCDPVEYKVTNIDKVAPEAPKATANETKPTNQDVTVTATFSDDSVTKQYSLDGGKTWKAYEPVVMEENGSVQFRGIDEATNPSEITVCEVTNIDKTVPTITVAADIITPTNGKVTVTPTFDDNVAVDLKKVSSDGESWSDYTAPVVMTKNGTVYFLCSDTAGNISQVVPYEVTNIDTVPPVVTVTADITKITNTDVIVSATATDDASEIASIQYSRDKGTTWLAYDAKTGVKFEENGNVLFKATDTAGNTCDPVEYKVENIDKVAPEAPVAKASKTDPTNQPVTVTATFSEDSATKESSIDGGKTWVAYTDGVVLDDNGTVQFRGIDVAGNTSAITSLEVTNIDKVAPEKPTATASTTAPTNQPVTVTAVFSDDSATKEFSIDGGTKWEAYDAETGVVFKDNGTVEFRGIDAAGNISAVTSLTVSNIDLGAPDAPTDITPSTTAPTKFDVIVKATFSADSVLKQFSLDDGDEKVWVDYADSGVIVKDNNTTVSFRGIDAAGNISKISSYKVTNIDKAVPTITVTASETKPTNQNVTVTAVFEDDNGVVTQQYSFDGGATWTAYTDPIEVAANITISFLACDGVGNFTITAYTVDNIDKIPPVAPVASADYTTPTNTDVIVTAVFSEDSVTKEYSIDGGTVWSAYDAENGVKFEENGTVLFRGIDAASNVSDVTPYTVDVIDKVAPTAPVVTLTPAGGKYTNLDVTVTAVFSEDTVTKQYTIDGGETWLDFGDGVDVSENLTISVRGLDAAGNASDLVTNTIDYIDKVAPTLTLSANITVPTTKIVTVSATVTDNTDYYQDIVEQVPVIDPKTGEQAVDDDGKQVFEDKVTGQKLVTNTVIYYSRDAGEEKTWLTYKDNPIKFTRNGEIFFYAEDEAGNKTDIISYNVWNIDKTAPTLTLSADITTPTNGIVQVSADGKDNFDDLYPDNLLIEYSRDAGDVKTWLTYKGNAIKFTRNGEIFFRATDAAGNVTTKSYKVDNIDKTPPAAPVASADITDPTNKPVTVFATFSEDTVKGEYSLNSGEDWFAYDAETGVGFVDNGSVLFRATDAAGNVSKFTKYEVTNIDLIPPEAPEAEASTVDPTNKPVTVFATFSEDTVSAEFSLDGEEWTAYDDAKGVVFEDNGTVFFRAFDDVDNMSDITEYNVTNIDLIPPEAPTASADITDPTNKDVTVTPVFSEDTVFGEFSLDGGETWEVYDSETGVVMEDNGTVEFRGYDAAGNVSEPFSFEVTNIDKIPPEAPVAAASTTELTRDPVTVTATFSEDTTKAEYSVNGEEWFAYDPEVGVVFEENGTAYFRAFDAVGNISTVTKYEVTNIDLIPPEEPIVFADVTTDTNRSVTLTAVFDEDAVTKQYSLDGEEWLAYDAEKGVVADENGKFFFRGIDAVGNISEVTEYDVTNIDKVAPVAPAVSADVTAPTKGAVTVTATFAEDSVSNLYSLDNGATWQEYTEGIKFEKNGLVMFISHDLAGNFSFNGYLVENIDLIAPDAPQLLSVEPRDFTNKAIVVKADFTEDSAVKEYSLDNKTWLAYDAEKGVTVDANGSLFFRAADSVGNVSDVTECTIWNIDTTAPEAATGLTAVVSDQTVALVWTPSVDDLSGVAEYTVTYGHDDKSFTAKTADARFLIENADYATWSWSVTATDAAGNTSLVAKGADFVVSDEPGPGPEPGPTPVATLAKNDIDGNGISDVLFQWTSGDGQIGFWMNGTNDWQGQAQPHDALWGVIGTYDMTADGKADLIMAGPAQIVDKGGLYIGYYIDSVDTDANWRTIGFLSSTDTSWNILAGNLTGTVGKNSIVWYSKDIYSLGIWKDGEEEWVALSDKFGGEDWTIAGIGDFDGDGKDSVLMSFQYSKQLYSVDIDGTATSLGAADWSGWDVAAIGDFAGDGKEDIVLFNQDLGSMVMLADGNADQFTSIGQLDAEDWFIVGAGDYNNDQKDDLLVRQFSTGMLGYYSTADQSKWVELGRGVDTNWTVIA